MQTVTLIVIALLVAGSVTGVIIYKVLERLKSDGFSQARSLTARFLTFAEDKRSSTYVNFCKPFMDAESDATREHIIRDFFTQHNASAFVMKRFSTYYAEVFFPWFLRSFEKKIGYCVGAQAARTHQFTGKSYTLIWEAVEEFKEQQQKLRVAAEKYSEEQRKKRTTEKKAQQAAANLVKAQMERKQAAMARNRKQKQFKSQVHQKRSALRNPSPQRVTILKESVDVAAQSELFLSSLSKETRKRFITANPATRAALIKKNSDVVPTVDVMTPGVFAALLDYQDVDSKPESTHSSVSHQADTASPHSEVSSSHDTAAGSHSSSSYSSYDSSSYSSFDGGSFGGGE